MEPRVLLELQREAIMKKADTTRPPFQTVKCSWFDCNNDAIGIVGRDPYDHVSWSPVVTPRPYCLNCYNERILDALDFIRSEK